MYILIHTTVNNIICYPILKVDMYQINYYYYNTYTKIWAGGVIVHCIDEGTIMAKMNYYTRNG